MSDLRRVRILLVEDDDDSRELFAELLSETYEVIVAATGEEGLVEFDKQKPDLVVTDQTLPGMYGTELATRVKARAPQTTVVLMSGHARIEGVQSCDAVLEKPVDVEGLLSMLAVLSQRHAPDRVLGSGPSAGGGK